MAPSTVDPFQGLLARSRDLGPVAGDRQLELLLTLKDASDARRAADLQAMYDPHAPAYLRFKTPDELASEYGPDPDAVARARAALQADGLTTDWSAGDDWLDVTGPAQTVDSTFGVDVRDYVSADGIRFYASIRDPEPPLSLRGIVSSASHISSYAAPARARRVAAVPETGLAPDDLLRAYDIDALRDQGIDGSGETVVVGAPDGGSFLQSDFDEFARQFSDQKYPVPPWQPAIEGPERAGDLTPGSDEWEMDIEVVHEIAPGAAIVLATNAAPNSTANAVNSLPNFFQQILAKHPGAIFTNSIGWCETAWGQALVNAVKSVFDTGDQAGDTVFVSTGDTAAYACLQLAWGAKPPSPANRAVQAPAVAPGVTAVGGTRLSVAEDGSWYNETVWEEPATTNGTGGGLSAYLAMPNWQQGPGVQNQFSNGKRQIPDVSADADPDSGVAVYQSAKNPRGEVEGSWGLGGGTSLATPIWAGITALVNQYLKSQGLKPAGFLNPALYALAGTHQAYPPFHDITDGTNLAYPATPGYDLATGLGTPDAWNLARDLAAYQKSGGR